MSPAYKLPKTATAPFCPSEIRGEITIPEGISLFQKWRYVAGPALLVSVGYIDPGNWATDITAGTRYGYDLLFIILLSNIAAIFLQSLSMRIGVVTGRDLAQLSKDNFKPRTNFCFWILAELSIIACDIAEVLGAGLAFHLLFGCSITQGLILTVLDTIIVLGLKGRGFRQIEAIVLGLLITIGLCFAYQLALVGPDWGAALVNMVPSFHAIGNSDRLYLAIGIIGATVMPHNLYLHSSIVQTRRFGNSDEAKREGIKLNMIDTVGSLLFAFVINSAILILAAAAFHGKVDATEAVSLEHAYTMLSPALGTVLAMYAFAIALLASGQSSTFTGTIAGQVILEGYMNLKIPCWQRRIITRSLALIPAIIGIQILGDSGLDGLLVLSQVVLGLQLPFVMYPLLKFSGDKKIMGIFAVNIWAKLFAWLLFFVIGGCNIWLIYLLTK